MMGSASDHFTYTPLDSQPGSFRLLLLKKGTGDKLEAEIIHTTVEKEYGRYEAISYTWGDSNLVDNIYVDNKPLGVTYNLTFILRDLRSPDTDRLLWNDATCINQKDNVERGQQVQQMSDFYHSAKAVLSCLGRPTELTDFLIDTINIFGGGLTQGCEIGGASKLLLDYVDSPGSLLEKWHEFLRAYESEHFLTMLRLTQAFHYMASSSWFRRVWVVQEVYNAREGIVHCGRNSVSAVLFALCGSFITPFSSSSIQSAAIPLLELMTKSSVPQHYTLVELITRFMSSEASDQYDKIYALMGMASDITGKSSLVPDYTISEAEVVAGTIAHICEWSEMLPPFSRISQILHPLPTLTSMLLLFALQQGNESVVQRMLDQGAEPWKKITFEHFSCIQSGSPIAWAASQGKISTVQRMISMHGISASASIAELHDPLRWAAKMGHIAVVEVLLSSGLAEFPNLKGDWTALSEAAARGHENIVKLLLDVEGIDINCGDRHEETPLMQAARKGREAVVKLLLNHEHIDVNSANEYGTTALIGAVNSGSEAVVKLLLNNEHIDVNRASNDGTTALTEAAWRGHAGILQLLLGAVQINLQQENKAYGGTMLSTAIYLATENGEPSTLKILLNLGKVDVTHFHRIGFRPLLHAATMSGKPASVEQLLAFGQFDVNEKDQFGRTPLMLAVRGGHEEIVQLLLGTGKADVNA